MKRAAVIALALAGVAALIWGFRGRGEEEQLHYRLTTITRGDVESVVSATGTLDAVTTVQVGTQVSGIIDEILVDYNDAVRAGEVVARIDTTLLASAVAGAEAQLARSEAELRQARREHTRIEALRANELASESEFNAAQYALDVARASVKSAEVDLSRARLNLNYATITSPIDGTVVARSVDVGQTVQASFSAPELFLIAGDLEQMQILVSVDESDIGEIAEGQTARFTVQAYPEDEFTGAVRQVRLQSATEENVVNYTVVVDVANPDRRLLPGMTATVDFLVETAEDVLYVANAALRYRPDEATMTAALARLRAAREERSGERESDAGGEAGGGAGARGEGAAGAGRGDRSAGASRGLLWAVDAAGELTAIPVRTGISDGANTAVTGRQLDEGTEVIAGASSRAVATNSVSTPFQQSQQQGGGRPGRPTPGGF